MVVNHHGFVFDTDTMSAFSTGERSTPTIYINENGLAFLERTRKCWVGPRLRHLQRMETRRLAVKYGLKGILEILDGQMCGSR